jgi:hypothetical protein
MPSTAISADDRDGLERLLRYMGRPPISEERLSQAADGRIIVRLKKYWSDGTSHLIMTPLDFLGRLTSLIPPPRKNMIRYHGVFAPNSALRAQVVPKPNQEILEGQESTEGNRCPGQGKRWAQLLARVFGIDVLACPRCESRMQMISFITESKAIKDILASLQMATAPPEVAPVRRSERQSEFSWA